MIRSPLGKGAIGNWALQVAAWVPIAASALLRPTIALGRPDKPKSGELWQYANPSEVETLDTVGGAFRLHFTRKGPDAVPAGDVNGDGFPDYVQELGETYEKVLTFYQKLGFAKPMSDEGGGGDNRFDVYLLDFAGKGDGNYVSESCLGEACAGYMVQENDFAGYGYPTTAYANAILSSHEFFHAVQAGYDVKQSSILSEGTAVWATEQYDSSLYDFENFLPGYLQHPDRSLDKPMIGPVDAFSYGSALFFQYLSERYGPQAILQLWKDCKNGAHGVANPNWFSALAALCEREFASSFAEEFSTFAMWNLRTAVYADPAVSYAKGASYPKVASLAGTLPYRDDDLRVFYASTQYLRFAPAGRSQVAVALAAKTDASALRLGMVARKGKQFGEWVWLSAPMQLPLWTVDTAGMDEVFVLAVNTAQGGESARGSLCVGSPEEAAKCLPPAPQPDSAGGDGAGGDGAGDPGADASGSGAELQDLTGTADTASAARPASDPGCAAVPNASGGGFRSAAWVVAATALWLLRRRRASAR